MPATDTLRAERDPAPTSRNPPDTDTSSGEANARQTSPLSATPIARRPIRRLKAARRKFGFRVSGLTIRILAINLLSVAILFIGVLYLDRYQNSLIRGELDALDRQAEVMARAVAELAVDSDATVDPGLITERVRRIVRVLSGVLASRVRIYGSEGRLIADSRMLTGPGGTVRIQPLPPPEPDPLQRFANRLYERIVNWLPRRSELPIWNETTGPAALFEDVQLALGGTVTRKVRGTEAGGLFLSVAVPVQRYKQVLGALMLSVEGEDIDTAVREVRFEILGMFAVTLAITILLSLYLAGTITRPIQRLASAAEAVRASHSRRQTIPDFGRRGDEIGDLSRSLKAMTEDLWARMDAIERFAADVAHEIKNPLTSLRSAVETATRVDDPERRQRLMTVIVDDVARLNRLISDISDASRVDAELSREDRSAVDVGRMLSALAEVYAATAEERGGPPVLAEVEDADALVVAGQEGRLVQVLRNLIENARSFSPPDGAIRLRARREGDQLAISVEDDGPGLPEGKLQAVFDRFYSERPEGEKFGTHSGLGLSISKQIVEAHGGTIRAENRRSAQGSVLGARFVLRLPLASPAR
ncbi:stimulus-sensing domain-containing protein [Thalassobaculum sp.]|uniref:sensor histidine kinase n=1 Tax=Thalassobaculum sp. TaxID=2022740 RepID=UPI0032EBE60D